jgi:hypothetical protein
MRQFTCNLRANKPPRPIVENFGCKHDKVREANRHATQLERGRSKGSISVDYADGLDANGQPYDALR